jgi:hypothetical protein
VDEISQKHRIYNFDHFANDALLVTIDEDQENFVNLLGFSKELLEKCVEISFPLRGSIIRGIPNKFNMDDSVISKAIEVEKMQEWIGIMVDSESHSEKITNNLLITYPIPLKENNVLKLYPALIWDVPNCDKLVKYLTGGGLVCPLDQQNVLTNESLSKATNTILFGIWVDCCKKGNRPTDKFYAGIPVMFVDMNIRKWLYGQN